MKIKIYYHHTDSGGVVYYAKYLEFLEEARAEFFAQKGISIKEWVGRGILFVVARQEIDYKAPSFYADTLEIETTLSEISRAKMEFSYQIKNQDNKLIITAKTVAVCVDKHFKPKSIPEEIKQALLQTIAK